MIRLALRVPRADAELVLAELLELAPSGVEERDLDGELVELAVYGPPGELPGLPDLRAAAGAALVEVSTTEIAEDWDERWKQFHKPTLIETPAPGRVPAIRVRPPWVPPHAAGRTVEIEIDPGQAFGTGAHATTELCLQLLLALSAEPPSDRGDLPGRSGQAGAARGGLLDLGTGSGVLAIAAAKLGYDPVAALDNDPVSVAAASENASRNGVAIDTRLFDLRTEALPRPGAPVVLANLLRPLLLQLASSLSGAPEHLIVGGLLREEADELASAFAEQADMRERERRCAGEWASLWLCARE